MPKAAEGAQRWPPWTATKAWFQHYRSIRGEQLAGPPAKPTPIPEIVAALRMIAPLDGLTEEEYRWIATNGSERVGGDRSIVFRENEPACNMNFILRGEVQVRRKSGTIALFIGRCGLDDGETSLLADEELWRGRLLGRGCLGDRHQRVTVSGDAGCHSFDGSAVRVGAAGPGCAR